MLPEAYNKQIRRWGDQIRLPSAHCQACLSTHSFEKDDIMIKCELCQGSIHKKHYGRQLPDNPITNIENWLCERCRQIWILAPHQKEAEIEAMQCSFCPIKRGIVKRVIVSGREMWLHPLCATWSYPFVYQKNHKRMNYTEEYPSSITAKFWVPLNLDAPCQVCGSKKGYKLKCMYPSCQVYYHCPCAKSVGFIRDLESMRLEKSEYYIPPYCQTHLQLRVEDCQIKSTKYADAGQEAKASHFRHMMSAYQKQLDNMLESASQYREQEELRQRMEYHHGDKHDVAQELSFSSQDSNSFHSEHPDDFYNAIFDADYPTKSKSVRKKSLPIQAPKPPPAQPSPEPQPMIDEAEEEKQALPLNHMDSFLKKVVSERPERSQRFNSEPQPQQSSWNNDDEAEESQQFDQ